MVFLLIPIGPPGSGKTFLATLLKNFFNDNIIIISRDEIHHNFRKTNSIRQSKHLTHKKIMDTIEKVKTQRKIVYIDTTNSNSGIRDIYIKASEPEKLLFISLKGTKKTLLSRIKNRDHITFPKNHIDQIVLFDKIMNSIDYPKKSIINIDIDTENLELVNNEYDNLFSSLQEYLYKN